MAAKLARKLLLITGTCTLAINAAQAQYKYGDGSGIGGYVNGIAVGGAGGGHRTPAGEGGGAAGLPPNAPTTPNVGGVGAPGTDINVPPYQAPGGAAPIVVNSATDPIEGPTRIQDGGSPNSGSDAGGGGGSVGAIINAATYELNGIYQGGYGGFPSFDNVNNKPRGSGGGGVALILNGQHFIVKGQVFGGSGQLRLAPDSQATDFGGGGALAVILNSGILDVYGSIIGGDGANRNNTLDTSGPSVNQGSGGGAIFMAGGTTVNAFPGSEISTGSFSYAVEKVGPAIIVSGDNSTINNQGLIYRKMVSGPDKVDSVNAPAIYVYGNNNKIINSSNITGNITLGLDDLLSTSYAIEFDGSNNTIELRAGNKMNGLVAAVSGTDNHFVLGGSANETFNFDFLEKKDPKGSPEFRLIGYMGFTDFTKDGASTWSASGVSAATGPWTITEGTLAFTGNASLATHSSMTVNSSLDISGIDNTTKLQNLTGSAAGSINLGSKTLILTNDTANIYAGVITGTGGNINIDTGNITFTGNNTYSGTTTIASGAKLEVGDGSTNGMVASNIDVEGDFSFKRSDDITFAKIISGSGTLNHEGNGLLKLTGENTHIGTFNIDTGNVQIGDDATNGSIQSNATIAANKTLSFNRSDQITYNGVVSGAGHLVQAGNGTLILSGNSTGFTGDTLVSQGTLNIQSVLGGTVKVNTAASLSGTGTINGDTDIVDGNLIGLAGGVLSFSSDLRLDANSNVNVGLGSPSTNELFNVLGNLTLGGKINVSDIGGFGPGIYRIFNYNGSLTNNNFEIGSTPSSLQGVMAVQTSIPNQVNLVANGAADDPTVSFWDGDNPANAMNGVIDGGDGTWNQQSLNWTNVDGSLQNAWEDGKFAIFAGSAGTVTIADALVASGIQFSTTDYKITGSPLLLKGDDVPIIRVDDGVTATVDAELQGNQGLNKTDFGTLILSGNNTYTGDTLVSQGSLQLGDGGNSGSVLGDIVLAKTDHDIGALKINRADDYALTGKISGEGGVSHLGTGTTTLTADNSFSGGLSVEKGTVKAGFDNTAFGTGNLAVNDGAIADLNGFDIIVSGLSDGNTGGGSVLLGANNLTLNQSSQESFFGTISGTGGLTKNGKGQLSLSGLNTYSGDTALNEGVIVQAALNALSGNSHYKINSNAELHLSSFNTQIAALSNNGSVNFGDNAETQLHITGDYISTDGNLYMKTVMGDDQSKTDKLIIDGNSTGNTSLYVKNLGGTGGSTNEGIKIVEVNGDSGGVFNLQGDFVTKSGEHAVVAGAYAYTLHQHGITDPNDGNWYLRSERKDGPGPIINPGTPVYQSATETVKALTNLPTLQQRVGNRYMETKHDLHNIKDDASGYNQEPVIWGRIEAAHDNFKGHRALAHTNQKINTLIIQSGVDGQLAETENGKWIAGITGQYGVATGNVTSDHGDGKINAKSWGLGATITWYGNDGIYFDGQSQVSWLKSDMKSTTVNKDLANDVSNTAFALSLEGGKRIPINDNWSLTPQAQLMWSHATNSKYTDVWGASVRSHNNDNLNLRLGLAVNYRQDWLGDDNLNRSSDLYAIANINQNLLSVAKVDISNKSFDITNDKTWADIGLGGTYNWANGKYALYGEGTLGTSLNNFSDSYTANITAGFKVKW